MSLFLLDSLSLSAMVLYAVLAAITVTTAPNRTTGRREGLALITVGTLIAYASGSLPVFCFGWALTTAPFFLGWMTGVSRAALGGGTLALAIGSWLASSGQPIPAFLCLVLATAIRKGIFPFHAWVCTGFERGQLCEFSLLQNGHLGAFLLMRYVIPQFPDLSQQALPILSVLALFTALFAAVLALAERNSRRILAMVAVSQASFILAGLENRNVEGITGALVHWFVVAVATTGLTAAFRALEARNAQATEPVDFLGLAAASPRLAVFFAILALALIGLPGTLGFAAEDLLFHGSLESHPLLGVTLPLATALNGITMFRLFSRLFLGRPAKRVPPLGALLPSERWALTAATIFLVATGLAPAVLVNLRAPAAEHLAALLGGR